MLTPLASDAENPLKLRDQNSITKQLRMLPTMDWSQFEPAITRWEQLIGREAPVPLIEQRLNPEFTEWMMGLPEGWITDLDLSWTQKIKACGNGVVPQAAAEALSRLT